MTILEESASEVTVLILFDGPKGGQPSVYRLRYQRPKFWEPMGDESPSLSSGRPNLKSVKVVTSRVDRYSAGFSGRWA